MKLSLHPSVCAGIQPARAAFLWLALAAAPAAFGAATTASATNTMVPFEFSFPKSVFVYDAATGRDPFFPSSSRTLPAAPASPSTATPTAAPGGGKPPADGTTRPSTFVLDRYLNLSLKGITGDRRFALINGQPFGVGESYNLKTTNGVLAVRCVEIRQRSVIMMIEGEKTSKEIHLRPGL